MFTSSEIKNIMDKSRDDMINLLKALNFRAESQDWYSEIDPFITREVCSLMKSQSIPEGYSFLLSAGGIPLDFSETPNERLAKVVKNRQIIEPAIIKRENIAISPQYETRFIVSSLYSQTTVKEDLKREFEAFISQYTQKDVIYSSGTWTSKISESLRYSSPEVTTRQKFRENVQKLREIIKQLPDTVNILKGDSSPQYKESELIEFLQRQNEYEAFVVSRCRVKIDSPKPDPNRKFTAQEADDMFRILEQINNLVNKI